MGQNEEKLGAASADGLLALESIFRYGLDTEKKHTPEFAAKLVFAAIIRQAYYDLSDPNENIKRDAQYYFHSDTSEEHADRLDDFNIFAVRERLIKLGLLPKNKPMPGDFD